MKALCFTATTAILLLFIFGCTQNQSVQLTQQQKEQIRNEVRPVVDSIVARYNRMDVDGCLNLYSSDLIVVGDTLKFDLEGYRKYWNDGNKDLASVKATTIRSDFIACTKDIVISVWVGNDELVLNSGEKIIINPHVFTLVFRKDAGQWKVIYSTASGNPIVQPAE
jgi:ketosteroid isomerase-like protein